MEVQTHSLSPTFQFHLLSQSTDTYSPPNNAPLNQPSLRHATAALKLQKVYRSYRTRRRLADSAVVVEELWWQAIDYVRLNHSTISFFNLPETAASRWSRVKLNAAKVGKGLSKDAKAQKLAFQHWIEAIDPRHRYGHNLQYYYKEWCKTDAGQPFFYWLDLGNGKNLDLEQCSRSKLQKQCIKYLGPKKKGLFHHSSFLAGGAALAAGRLVAEHGIIKSISAYSGHYRPTDDTLNGFLSYLKENGVKLDEVEMGKANEDSDIYEDSNNLSETATPESIGKLYVPEISEGATNAPSSVKEDPQPESVPYTRTLSGGLQSPRALVPKTAILQRINAKKASKSYQLGHRLSLKWSTGAGPRIGCVADYPIELRKQALEMLNLSPKLPPTPSSYMQLGALALSSPYPSPSSSCGNMGGTCVN